MLNIFKNLKKLFKNYKKLKLNIACLKFELIQNFKKIIISSVDREGTGEGFDIELTKMISESVSIPVIAHGGAGSINDIINVIKIGKAPTL